MHNKSKDIDIGHHIVENCADWTMTQQRFELVISIYVMGNLNNSTNS